MIDVRGFILNESVHFLLTGLVGAFLFWRFRDWKLILISFITGVLIDVDHWFDYFAYYGLDINFANFFDVGSYVKPSGKVYILFHGWEYLFPFWLIGRWGARKKKIEGLAWALCLPYLVHLIWDVFTIPTHFLFYSFIYRWLNHFNLRSLI